MAVPMAQLQLPQGTPPQSSADITSLMQMLEKAGVGKDNLAMKALQTKQGLATAREGVQSTAMAGMLKAM